MSTAGKRCDSGWSVCISDPTLLGTGTSGFGACALPWQYGAQHGSFIVLTRTVERLNHRLHAWCPTTEVQVFGLERQQLTRQQAQIPALDAVFDTRRNEHAFLAIVLARIPQPANCHVLARREDGVELLRCTDGLRCRR